jgi:hypothetical protein
VTGLVSWPIVRATFRERLTPLAGFWILVLVFLGLGRGATSPGAEAFSGGSYGWFALLVLMLGAGLLSNEVESGHAQLVLLKPITRAQWVSGRFIGAAAVLCLGAALAWGGSVVAAVVRSGVGDPAFSIRFLVLPLALLPALAWLAIATALSAVVRGFGNVAILVAAKFAWLLVRYPLPPLVPQLGLQPIVDALDPYIGPQDALSLTGDWAAGNKLLVSVPLLDLFWLFAAWTLAVWLFNQRELARRRA